MSRRNRSSVTNSCSVSHGCSWLQNRITVFFHLLITVYRICSLITANIQITDYQRVTITLFDIQFYRALDGSTEIISTVYVIVLTTSNSEFDTTSHIGIHSSAIDILHACNTVDDYQSASIHIGIPTTTVHFRDLAET